MDEADGSVVSNSGPLIGLAAVSRLHLLKDLYGFALIPDAVYEEVAGAGHDRPGAAELEEAKWLQRVAVNPPPDRLLLEELGRGEAEAITLAVHLKARLLVLDDRKARRIAEIAYGIRVKGVAGILVSAKRKGLLSEVIPVLDAMRTAGYYLSERVLSAVRQEAGE